MVESIKTRVLQTSTLGLFPDVIAWLARTRWKELGAKVEFFKCRLFWLGMIQNFEKLMQSWIEDSDNEEDAFAENLETEQDFGDA